MIQASTVREALAEGNVTALLRVAECDGFMESDIHGPMCVARIGAVVIVCPPGGEGMMIARSESEAVAMDVYERHCTAMRQVERLHRVVCSHGDDAPTTLNPLMELLDSETPDALPPEWQ